MEAFIFINSEPGMLWEIAETARKIEGVKMAKAVTGQFDIIIYVDFIDMDVLREIINRFQSLKGVQRTQTSLVVPQLTYNSNGVKVLNAKKSEQFDLFDT